MILKEYEHRPDADPRSEETCADAATRLTNAFKSNEDVIVLNDIRLPFEEERSLNVDQVVIHTYGISLINSRTIYGKIEINYRGEWSRSVKSKEVAMQNPIEIYKHITKMLRENLTANSNILLANYNKDQNRSFENMPVDVFFVQALKSSIIGTGINQSNIIFNESLTQNINRNFSAYKKREFQVYGGLDTFKISRNDMYAVANFLMGNEIDRSTYPDADEDAPNTDGNSPVQAKPRGRVGIIRAQSTRPIKIIKGSSILPSRKKLNEQQEQLEAEQQTEEGLIEE